MKLDRLMRDPALLPAFERALGVRTDAELKQLEMQGNICLLYTSDAADD